MKKLVIAVLLLALLAGCGGPKPQENSGQLQGGETTSAAVDDPGGSGSAGAQSASEHASSGALENPEV